MFSLKNINVYFLAIKTNSKKFIKDIFFKSDLYNSKIIEKGENKFLFFLQALINYLYDLLLKFYNKILFLSINFILVSKSLIFYNVKKDSKKQINFF